MSYTIHLNGRSNIAIDPLPATASKGAMVLVTFEGHLHGEALNCALIPLGKMPELIETLRLAASLLQK